MLNFNFQNTTEIVFGMGVEEEVGKKVSKYGKKLLLHYGGTSLKKFGLYDKIVKNLTDEGIEIFELGGVLPNPRLSLVREGIKICKDNNIDFILAVGGGSAIDSAKAIGVGVKYDGDVWDFFEKRETVSDTLPLGVVLTIPAAGSETSKSCVLTNEDGWYKKSFSDSIIRPKFTIMNPEVTYTLPAKQTAAGAVDMMSHVLERYFTNEKHVELTDRLSEGVLKTIISNTPKVLDFPENYNARAEIMISSTIAHNGLLDIGRESDWASHKIEHEISALYDIAHGAGLAIILPAWMKYVYRTNIDRFVQFANRVWNIDVNFDDPEAVVLEGIKRTEEFFTSIDMPTRLSQADIDGDKFEEMASRATQNGTLGNFVKLTKEDIINIYKLAE
ncbi:MAG: iron-containing alcohol dehydrogenase [Psychrilyobacter sp.]|uniref:iron-containing alcohol dehydrogenase n=1 Tax=Psychrilyobacter sp. TaxID=2586924 RepID=UPI003C772FE3